MGETSTAAVALSRSATTGWARRTVTATAATTAPEIPSQGAVVRPGAGPKRARVARTVWLVRNVEPLRPEAPARPPSQ
ncbi:hypothetical protein GCM10023214_14410 [Amycolatopsis dongchuanensis]|uniref:Uncharacterized protein n=1 Tax=Amycolatopsis dongchuanensis TaxID=1070866 RepID=A0ABP9Q4C9_9PSEU